MTEKAQPRLTSHDDVVAPTLSPTTTPSWSKTTLNYWMMMERYPNLKEKVGSLIPDCEISSLFARWSTASCASVLTCRLSVKKKKKEKRKNHA